MNNVIVLLGFFVVVSSSLVIGFFVIKFINTKTKGINSVIKMTKWKDQMVRLDRIVKSSVIATNQTFVSPLKETNSFSQLDKEEAFVSCREKIYKSLAEENDNICYQYICNLDEWINNRIEYYVKQNKQ